MLLTKKNIMALMPISHANLMSYARENRHVSRINDILYRAINRGKITKHQREYELTGDDGKVIKTVTIHYSLAAA